MAKSLVDKTVDRLRQLLREHRRAGVDRLPPEAELSAQMGVGRSTLREAMALLEAEGEIERKRRLGTIIRQPPDWGPATPAYPVHLIMALSEFLDASGVAHRIQEFTVRTVTAPPAVAESLALEEHADAFHVRRLYVVDGQRGALVEHYLPITIDGEYVRIEALTDGTTTFLEEIHDLELSNVENLIVAEAAGSLEFEQLEVEKGSPVLVMYAKLFAQGIGPVALGRMAFRPDVLCMTVRAVGHQAVVPNSSGPPAWPSRQEVGA